MKQSICPYCQFELRGKYEYYCPNCGALVDLSQFETRKSRMELLYEEARTAITLEKWRLAITNLRTILYFEPKNIKVISLLNEARLREKIAKYYIQGQLNFYNKRWVKSLNYFNKIKDIRSNYMDVNDLIQEAENQIITEKRIRSRKPIIFIEQFLLIIIMLLLGLLLIGLMIYFFLLNGNNIWQDTITTDWSINIQNLLL